MHEWPERFTYWLGLGQNAIAVQVYTTVVLVLITAWYAYLTRGLLKVGQSQILQQVRPKLRFKLDCVGNFMKGQLLVENFGECAAKFLDITLRCFVWKGNRRVSTASLHLSEFQGSIIEAKTQLPIPYDFVTQLANLPGIEHLTMSFGFFIVATDLSEHVYQTFMYNPIANKILVGDRRPLRILWQQRPSIWRPFKKLKDWLIW